MKKRNLGLINTGLVPDLTGKWHAVSVRSEEDVARLDALMRRGWYLPGLDLDGLPYLAFHVPLGGTHPPSRQKFVAVNPESWKDQILVLMLYKGTVKGLQRALAVPPDERGYFDMKVLQNEPDAAPEQWDLCVTLRIDARTHLVIFERKS